MTEFACYLSQEALLQLHGKNVAAFLQGQLSCDTRHLNPDQAIAGAFCNVKGRVITDVTLVQITSDHCLLRLRASLAESVAVALGRYAQFSRISVATEELKHSILGCYDSPDAAADTHQTEKAAAVTPLRVEQSDGLVSVFRANTQVEHILIDEGARDALDAKQQNRQTGLESTWRADSLRQGHYALELADSEQFTPQALNYDETGLVAFNKGCYTGQEVVARLHYKGKSKKRLGIYTLPAGAAPAPRDAIILDSEGGKLGRVLRCETSLGETSVLAAEVQSDRREDIAWLESGSRLTPILRFPQPA